MSGQEGIERRGRFRVSVTKDDLVFSSAHFLTLAGHRCERLHGHNYRARATVEGEVSGETWFVLDFVRLSGMMRRLCGEIDHTVLLPLENPDVQVVEAGDAVTVSCPGGARYVFPRGDCSLLPVPNTTAEMLAELLAARLRAELDKTGGEAAVVTAIEMEVEENFGQSAVCRIEWR